MSGFSNVFRSTFVFCAVMLATGSICSCTNGEQAGPSADQGHMDIVSTGLTRSVSDNTQIYLFDGQGADRGEFRQRIFSISRTVDDKLSIPVPYGTWDLTLVSTNDDNELDISQPIAGTSRTGQKMYELKPINGVLYSAPELITAEVSGQVINPGQTHQASTIYSRNVALVQFVIEDASSLDSGGEHQISVGNIPTTIDWDGRLLPNATYPTTSTMRMLGEFEVLSTNGVQHTNTVSFLVPAHKGTAAADTTKCQLDVMVSLDMQSGGRYETSLPVKVPLVPRANEILQVKLMLNAELNIVSDILPWHEETYADDLANPYSELQVSKGRSTFPNRDTILVSSNSGLPEIEVGADWLRASFIDSRRLVITADATTYTGTGRDSWVDLTVNNFTKRIGVRQEHVGSGTLTASPPLVWISPNTPSRVKGFSLQTGGALPVSWRIANHSSTSYIYNVSPISGTGTMQINMLGKFHTNDADKYRVYGNDTLRIYNVETLETLRVPVANCFMQSDNIYVSPPKGAGRTDTTTYSSAIEIFGGDGRFTVDPVNKSPWILSAECVENHDPDTYGDAPYILEIRTQREPNDEERTGYIWVAHELDPAYKIMVPVLQEFYTETLPFDFFVIKFTWAANDVDIAVEITNPEMNVPFANVPYNPSYVGGRLPHKALGFGLSDFVGLDGRISPNPATNGPFMHEFDNPSNFFFYGGDALDAEGETVFFKAPLITPPSPKEDFSGMPRYIKIDIWAIWYGNTPASNPLGVTISTYNGGYMYKPRMDNPFNNSFPPGATKIYATNFYNIDHVGIPLPTALESQILGPEGWKYVNGPASDEAVIRKVGVLNKSGMFMEADFRNNYQHVATVTYDRYKRRAMIPNSDWYLDDYTGPIVVPLKAEIVTEESLRAKEEALRLRKAEKMRYLTGQTE